ncbi:hypothetical protein ZWY2020_057900 [Hordeum vulgare]|nr:hypothetical protein ZWY2020_057900 [Hordeum vulgare]
MMGLASPAEPVRSYASAVRAGPVKEEELSAASNAQRVKRRGRRERPAGDEAGTARSEKRERRTGDGDGDREMTMPPASRRIDKGEERGGV